VLAVPALVFVIASNSRKTPYRIPGFHRLKFPGIIGGS